MTVYPTGYPPIDLGEVTTYHSTTMQVGPKRFVMVALHENSRGVTAVMTLQSDWDDERNHCIVPFANIKDANMREACDTFHEAAPLLLPPGAGYPGTDEYALRQTKLRGQVQHAAITGLTECLALRHEAKNT